MALAVARPDGEPPNTRRAATPEVIIDVAERLWGDRGIDAVSLREISTAAGLSNPASVQYHFGDKNGLVWAIFVSRLPALDRRRGRMLQRLRRAGPLTDAAALFDCLFRPLFEQKNAEGRRSYAAFLNRLLLDASWTELRGKAMAMTPATDELVEAIHALKPSLDLETKNVRMIACNALVLSLICRADRERHPVAMAEAAFRDSVGMAAAAYLAN